MAEQQQKNKQFCKEFLSQLNTTILPADVKCSKENSNAQQEQDNGEKSGMNLDQMTNTHRLSGYFWNIKMPFIWKKDWYKLYIVLLKL